MVSNIEAILVFRLLWIGRHKCWHSLGLCELSI